jgi:urease accessory protein
VSERAPLSLPRLLQLASPALPVGAFSYSQGLESAIETGCVRDLATARAWIEDHLMLVLARMEGPVYAEAHGRWLDRDWTGLAALNAGFIATRESSEPRAETLQVGHAYTAWMTQVPPLDDAARAGLATLTGAHRLAAPVAAAMAAASLGLDAGAGLTGYLFGFVENQVMVLAKALPLGQIAGQRLLLAVAERLPEAVALACALAARDREGERTSAAPMLAILAMQHETQYSRLFRS